MFLTQAQVKSLKILFTAFTDFVALQLIFGGEFLGYCPALGAGAEGEAGGYSPRGGGFAATCLQPSEATAFPLCGVSGSQRLNDLPSM